MYRAVYSFKSNDSNALDFKENDLFTVIDRNRDQHWWLVQNGKGQIGFVPANYLKKNEASLADVVQSIDRAILIIRQSAPMGNLQNLTQLQKANLEKLERHKDRVIEEYNQQMSRDKIHPIRRAPDAPTGGSRSSSKRSSAPPPPPVRYSVLSSPTSLNPGQSAPAAQTETNQNGANQTYANAQLPASDAFNTVQNSSPIYEQVGDVQITGKISNLSHVTSQNSNHDGKREAVKSDVDKSAEIAKNLSSSKQNCVEGELPCCKHCLNNLPNSTIDSNNTKLYRGIGRKLVEKMRSNTQLSYSKSQQAVDVVLQCLRSDIPQIAHVMEAVLHSVHKQDMDTSHVDLSTDDAVRLHEIFEELAKCKDDSQQRSWFLHEDEHIISGHLEELLSVLDGARADVSKAIVRQDDFSPINNLVLYYQMETRANLRLLLLQVFGSLCALDAVFISEILNSVLPLELARDIQTDVTDIQKLRYSCLVLTMIFSMGESIPLQYYTHLDHTFIHYLFDMVEQPPESDTNHQIPELVVNLILSYNLHFELPSDNTVMKVLAAKGTSKLFTERLMFLFNRADDPVRMFEHEPKPPNSLLKFLCDLYSSRETSGVVYTNDAMVLIDIIVGQITDLSPSDQMRTEYLSLMELILSNTEYSEHCHRHADLQLCFRRIITEEEEANDMDKVIVRQIYQQFPDLFQPSSV